MARTKAFDVDEVLKKAMMLFWENGYHGTSMQMLVDRLGINRASIYDTFGDKKKLYQQSLERYKKDSFSSLRQFVADRGYNLGTIQDLFTETILSDLNTKDKRGCFAINTTTELANQDPVVFSWLVDNKKDFIAFFEEILSGAQQNHQLGSSVNIPAAASFLFVLYSGLKVQVKLAMSQKELNSIIETAFRQLEP